MEYPVYANTTATEVSWLGDVPQHWEVKAIKRNTPVFRGASPRPIQDPKYFDDDGEYAWVRIADVTASDRYLTSTTQRMSDLGKSLSVPLEPGSLFLSIAGSVGKPMITAIKCCIHDGFVYFPFLDGDPEFLYYVFRSGRPYLGLGKMGTQLNLNTDTVGAIKIGFPPEPEQAQIVRFLDYKTGQINQLIDNKRELIEKLEEKRFAVITQAVTKGLDESVKLKPSGIDWLGDVPSYWQAFPLKFACKLLRDGTHQPPPRVDDGVPLLSVRNIVDGEFVFRPDDSRISLEDYHELCRSFIPIEGDVLLAVVGATLGKVALIKSMSEFHIQRSLAVFRAIDEVMLNTYLAYVLQCKNFQDLLWQNVGFSAQPGIYLGVLSNFDIPVPPRDEQTKISQYCDAEVAQVNGLLTKSKEALELLIEYRSALITAAVAGKIDVRGFEVPGEIS